MAQVCFVQGIGGFTDLPLPAHKDKDIPGAFPSQFMNGIQNALSQVTIRIILFPHDRTITDFHRIGTSGDFNNRCITKMTGKPLRINGRGGDNHFQIRTFWQQLAQIAEDKIDIQTAFVGFIDDNGVILQQQLVLL